MSSNTLTARPSDLALLLKQSLRVKRPTFIWGPPGIGKSDIIRQIGEETGRPVVDLRMALMEPTDLRGMPYYCTTDGTMKWAQPSELPRKGFKENAILFLDELNSAPPSVQAAAYQLVLDRRVGEYELPKDVVIIAAGNRETDKGVTYRMPAPLANRFLHIEVEANFDDWQNWAVQNGVHPDVVGFLSSYKSYLYKFDPKSPDKAFATPRSWNFVSDFVTDSLPEKLLRMAVAGCVGEGMATEFMQHRRIAAKLPHPSEILAGKAKKLTIKEISAKYSLTIACCYLMKEMADKLQDPENKDVTVEDFHAAGDNFLRYTMDNFETEMNILGATIVFSTFKLPFKIKQLKNFPEFTKNYMEFVIDVNDTSK